MAEAEELTLIVKPMMKISDATEEELQKFEASGAREEHGYIPDETVYWPEHEVTVHGKEGNEPTWSDLGSMLDFENPEVVQRWLEIKGIDQADVEFELLCKHLRTNMKLETGQIKLMIPGEFAESFHLNTTSNIIDVLEDPEDDDGPQQPVVWIVRMERNKKAVKWLQFMRGADDKGPGSFSGHADLFTKNAKGKKKGGNLKSKAQEELDLGQMEA